MKHISEYVIKENIKPNKDVIQNYINDYLISESGQYVIFDGTSKIVYKGTLEECIAYNQYYNDHEDMGIIHSIEAYDKMIRCINK